MQHGHKQQFGDLFENLFTQPDKEDEPEPAAKMCKVSTSTLVLVHILTEIKQFCDSRIPMRARLKKLFFKIAQPSAVFWVLLRVGVLLGFLDKQEKIGKIIQELGNLEP